VAVLVDTNVLVYRYDFRYPDKQRIAERAATYQLSWFDAHLWAYAEFYGLPELVSEDFTHGRIYGTVRAVDPFSPNSAVHESPAR